VRRKIGLYCKLCQDSNCKHKAPPKQFPSVTVLRDHYVKAHHHDFCELCLESKPVLLFEQKLMVYSALQKHIGEAHPKCWFCPNRYFYDLESLNVHYRKDHYFCDVCRKIGKRTRQVSRMTNNLPEFEVFRDV
jgi:hypothetical protein